MQPCNTVEILSARVVNDVNVPVQPEPPCPIVGQASLSDTVRVFAFAMILSRPPCVYIYMNAIQPRMRPVIEFAPLTEPRSVIERAVAND